LRLYSLEDVRLCIERYIEHLNTKNVSWGLAGQYTRSPGFPLPVSIDNKGRKWDGEAVEKWAKEKWNAKSN